MIAVYVSCTVSEENVEKFVALATDLVSETRKETGNISYELIRGVENKNLFAFLEKWVNSEVLKNHMDTIHFKTIVPQLDELAKEEMKISVHEVVI